jgi:hypothetical protein
MNLSLTATAAAVILLAGAAGGLAGHLAAVGQAAPAPASCHTPSLPSGDAIKVDARGNAWTPDTAVGGSYREYVCTDGRWIPVEAYGTAPSAGPSPAQQTVLCEFTHRAGTCPAVIP